MLETLLKPNTGASLSGCVRWTQPMDGVRVCDFDCALTVPPALPAEPSEVPCEVLFCRQGGLRLTMTDGRQVFLQEHEVLLLLGASVQSLSVADGLFSGVEFEKFDVILAMYHDQGMIPFKTIEGNEGAVLLAGLPIVYTSTVHGMAYDITGQGIADESGMRNALYLAIDVYNNRQMNAELAQNPLRHYDIASNSNESDLNVEQIAGIEKEME